MTRTELKSVDEYIASQPEAARAALELVRGAIRKAIPDAEESISYQMPTYKRSGATVLYFAGWKQHYSLYPATAHIIATFKTDLAPYAVIKDTIRFPFSLPVPEKLIERIARLRAVEVAESPKAKIAVASPNPARSGDPASARPRSSRSKQPKSPRSP